MTVATWEDLGLAAFSTWTIEKLTGHARCGGYKKHGFIADLAVRDLSAEWSSRNVETM